MSDTETMVRLMERAADLLGAQKDATTVVHGARYVLPVSVVAAIAFGEATLRMVAASAAPESRSVVARLRDYAEWADETDDAAVLTAAEIASVQRFFAKEDDR